MLPIVKNRTDAARRHAHALELLADARRMATRSEDLRDRQRAVTLDYRTAFPAI